MRRNSEEPAGGIRSGEEDGEKWRGRPVSESVEAVKGGALAGGGMFGHGESRKKRGGVDGEAGESKKW